MLESFVENVLRQLDQKKHDTIELMLSGLPQEQYRELVGVTRGILLAQDVILEMLKKDFNDTIRDDGTSD